MTTIEMLSLPSNSSRGDLRKIVAPLVLAQFVASYAGTNMNVAINDIAHDLDTTVRGVQTAITLFTLTMAALMIPGSKFTDIVGRKRCFQIGLCIYGTGALLASLAQGEALLIVGYSLFEGVGSALMIPPIYILITLWFSDIQTRARYFGVVSAAAGVGAAAGPLIGGFITTALSWRASFGLQVLIVVSIIVLSRRVVDPPVVEPRPTLDIRGTIYSALGLAGIVFGVLQSGTYGWIRSREDWTIGDFVLISKGGVSPVWVYMVIGALLLYVFFRHIARFERENKQPLLSLAVFRNRTANIGLFTQNIQWLALQGSFFTVSVFVQTVRDKNAVETGILLAPSTIGILLSSALAERFAKRRSQATLIRAGFGLLIVGSLTMLALIRVTSDSTSYIPGLLIMGVGIGMMLTASVNVVQSSFGEDEQGEISGLSRSVSNLGSSLGTAIVGSVIAASVLVDSREFGLAMIVMSAFAAAGFIATLWLPKKKVTAA